MSPPESPLAATGGEPAPTISSQAYAVLRADILSGEIEPGTKLKMEELQRRYRFSSSPLREALNRLAAEQLVTVDERRGFRAARASLADLRDITRFRLIIETSAFDASMTHGTAEWEAESVAALHRLDALTKALPTKTRSWDRAWIESHKAFHTALVSACGSSRLLAACSAMFDQSQRYRSLSAKHRTSPRSSGAEHRRLLEVALRRENSVGTQLLAEHIQKTADQVARYLAGADGAAPVRSARWAGGLDLSPPQGDNHD
jgi:GntR family carbon starvation induced transcriptional regulator